MPVRMILVAIAVAWGGECTAAAAEPRAARSVHLGYESGPATAFSIEMTVLASTPGSYFMAAGWNTGYFGLQELSDGRKVVIFSVWDPTTGDDPQAVRDVDRVACLFQAPDMRVKRFGGEGTGGQCLGDFSWKIGAPVRFGVTAVVDGDATVYAGFVSPSGADAWKHLVTFRTRTGGAPLRGLYSFVEDFRRDGRSAHEVREARYGDGWVCTDAGAWKPLGQARFTASNGEGEARDTIDAGVLPDAWTLATGGDVRQSRPLGTVLQIADRAAAEPPAVVRRLLPAAP